MERIPRKVTYIDNENVPTCMPQFGMFVYSTLTPTICLFGIAGNLICLIVLTKMQTRCSFYVYLSVIATVDFLACIVIFASGLSRGMLSENSEWEMFDALVFFPIGGFMNCISASATLLVTVDRLIYLKNPTQTCKPKFCKRGMAGRIMFFVVCGSGVYILPYFFLFRLNEKGELKKTPFYGSIYFTIHNWLDIYLFAVVPVIALSIGNTMLLLSIRNACKTLEDSKTKIGNGKMRTIVVSIIPSDQTKITITLLAIVFFYLIGEVPTHLTRRITSANILFGGDEKKAEESVMLEYFRIITTLLNALHLAMKFTLYAYFCPPFYKALKKSMSFKKHLKVKTAAVKLYLIDAHFLATVRKCAKVKHDLGKTKILGSFIGKSEALKVQNVLC
ncbi:hypothetical protein RI129_003694 [Pyrocoelia pectoralis]|uniref:G-protein coupled receptors family 1 profile domain-containing protein n=1 Tax=Pyrocoelia pectoralis TaxID=417401 RepID=A0AAN7ZNB1_9COLE